MPIYNRTPYWIFIFSIPYPLKILFLAYHQFLLFLFIHVCFLVNFTWQPSSTWTGRLWWVIQNKWNFWPVWKSLIFLSGIQETNSFATWGKHLNFAWCLPPVLQENLSNSIRWLNKTLFSLVPRSWNFFLILNSVEHEIFPANKY